MMVISEDTKAVIEAMTRKMDEHELLVRIDERGKVYERDIKTLFMTQAEESAKRAQEVEDVKTRFELELMSVKKDVKGVLRGRDMVSGILAFLGFVGLILSILISYFKLVGGA